MKERFKQLFKLGYILSLILSVISFAGCRTTKRLANDEILLRRVKISEPTERIDLEEANTYVKQFSNKKFLGFLPLNLMLYNIPNPEKIPIKIEKKKQRILKRNKQRKIRGKDTLNYRKTWRERLTKNMGEPPVIYDSILTKKSAEQLKLYLKRKGFYHGNVSYNTKLNRRKDKIVVSYFLNPGDPYTVGEVEYHIKDSFLLKELRSFKKNSLINEGVVFDIDVLDAERERITKNLLTKGYYSFSKEFIRFIADTNYQDKKVNMVMEINPVKNGEKVLIKPFRIRDIKFYIDYNAKINPSNIRDTTFKKHDFYYELEMPFSLELLVRSIFINEGGIYNLDDVNYSYKRLSSLGVFKGINLIFQTLEKEGLPDKLDCSIFLNSAKKKTFAIESNGINRGGNLGINGNISFTHKNAFGGGERVKVSMLGGIEGQKFLARKNQSREGFINTIEFGPSVSLRMPKFFLNPLNIDKISRRTIPFTIVSSSFNFQNRPSYYRRSIANITYGYQWKESNSKDHFLNPFNISLIKIQKLKPFQQILDSISDQFLEYSYNDHLILSTDYTFVFNSIRKENKSKNPNVFYYLGKLEVAGNALRSMYSLIGAEKDTLNSYRLFNIRFAHYVKIYNDFRYFRKFKMNRSLGFRMLAGVGIPLKNLEALPFEKSFFSGGANSLRAWRAYSVGPGAYLDTTFRSDKIGDIQLEWNIEYRFGLIKRLEGAVFIDAGNIWLVKGDRNRIEGVFDQKRFLSEIALGTGAGIRLNFDFFIIRFDIGLPLKSPYYPQGQRWIYEPTDKFEQRKYLPNFNLGIGYPF